MNRYNYNTMARTNKFEKLPNIQPKLLEALTVMGFANALAEQDMMLPMLFADIYRSNVVAQSHVNERILVLFVSAMLNRVDPTQPHLQALCGVQSIKMGKDIMEIASDITVLAPIQIVLVDDDTTFDVDDLDSELYNAQVVIFLVKHYEKIRQYENYHITRRLKWEFYHVKILLLVDSNEKFTVEEEDTMKSFLFRNRFKWLYLSPSANDSKIQVDRGIHFDFTQKPVSMDRVIHFYVRCNDQNEKSRLIQSNFPYLTGRHPGIYYCQNHQTVCWLYEKMRERIHCNKYSSEMTLEEQKEGLLTTKIKFTTDDLPDNLYISEVPYIVNVDIPMNGSGKVDIDCYFRRISRLCHRGEGFVCVINFIDSEEAMEACREIVKHSGKAMYSLCDEADFNNVNVARRARRVKRQSIEEIFVTFFRILFCKNDVESPLSTKTFEEIGLRHKPYNSASRPEMKTTKMMEATMSALHENPQRNLIAQGQAGTGKTIAMELAMLNRIESQVEPKNVVRLLPKGYVKALHLSASAELSLQIRDLQFPFSISNSFPESSSKYGSHVFSHCPKLLVDAMNKSFFDISMVEVLAMDDADLIISTPNLWNDFMLLLRKLSPDCQFMLFSTTYSAATMKKALEFAKDPILIRIPHEAELPQNLTQYYVTYLSSEEKYHVISKLLNAMTVFDFVVFCNTKQTALDVEERLKRVKNLAMRVRDIFPDDNVTHDDAPPFFIESSDVEKSILIASTLSYCSKYNSASSRLVINFDMPFDEHGVLKYETYVQRVSATGRFGQPGIVVNIIYGDKRSELLACRAIEQHFGKKVHCITSYDLQSPVD